MSVGKVLPCCLLLIGALTAGCGSDSPYAPVQGTVTLDGQPLADAAVAFTPKISGGRRGLGVTRSDGTFELSTLQPGDGALLGEHVVTVTAVDVVQSERTKAMADEFGSLAEDMPAPPPKKVWRAPKSYSQADTSGLEFTVEPGRNTADFALKKEPS